MRIECNCNHCSARLRFDAKDAGTTIACPTCGMDTRLYVPSGSPLPDNPLPFAAAASSVLSNTPRETLEAIRSNSCYNTLRGLIGVMQFLLFTAAVFVVTAGIVGVVQPGPDVASKVVELIGSVVVALVMITLAIAGKQAALLLVDIADCQIQQAAREPISK